MRARSLAAIAFTVLVSLVSGATATGQAPKAPAARDGKKPAAAKPWKAPRTADGQPDLQGIWTMATFTPLERPAAFAGKEFFTEEEAAELVKDLTADGVNPLAGAGGSQTPLAAATPEERRQQLRQKDDDVHYDNSIWAGERQPKGLSTLRTSLVVDPPDGKIPPMTPAAQTRDDERFKTSTFLWDITPHLKDDSYERRSFHERCLVWRHEGPPMLNPSYLDRLEIFQNKDYVVIQQELSNNQVRIIPVDGRPHLSTSIRQWPGDSRGHWEGQTLVVDTVNFTDKTHFKGSGDALHVVERFTRVDADTIRYEFTVEDPTAWTRPWSAEIPMKKADGPLIEYACHEGNYALPGMLGAARKQEAEAAEGARVRTEPVDHAK